MKMNRMDQLLQDAYNVEIVPSKHLVARTKNRIKSHRGLSCLIGLSTILNTSTMLAIIAFILFSDYNIIVKMSVFMALSTVSNLIILIIYLSRDKIGNIFSRLNLNYI